MIVLYIIMAMKETGSSEHQPDPAFLAEANASIKQPSNMTANDDTQAQEKVE